MEFLYQAVLTHSTGGYERASSQTSQIVTGEQTCKNAIKAFIGKQGFSIGDGAFFGRSNDKDGTTREAHCIPNGKE